ncbi:hypothetical protein BCR35DRAFT_309276 [Leucosporidium creatinivorum]|uniref:Uncharacterized protein n=1 Tax=Leucosporidium creatinivorum TaxID=106004 RepID=A0A1Y2DJI1_9BASI|nr:hypothetical protein BCR35DRAFT_309276 [Leucosporidium creatinivorum]
MRPTESLYFSTSNPPALATLNEEDTLKYLARLNLPLTLIEEPPSLDLLAALLFAHHTNVPFGTTPIHVPRADWTADDKPIELGAGVAGGVGGMDLGAGNFKRVVEQWGTGFCFSLNSLFASLLRGFGFRTSEVGTRVYLHRGKDPAEAGYLWSPITHELLIVDWPESEGERWMVDVGFGGGGSPRPIALRDGATSASISPSESFLLRAENLPIGDIPTIYDPAPGYTLYRRVCSVDDFVLAEDLNLEEGQYWTPCVHFTLQTLLPEDVTILNYYNESFPKAPFVNFFVVSLLLATGARRTLSYAPPPAGTKSEELYEASQKAKLYTKEGIKGEEQDISFVPFTTSAIRRVLENEFGFRFE